MKRIAALTALAALIVGFSTAALAADAPAQVVFVGTFHFDNPGLDFVKSDVPDVLTPERQKEIAAIVESLKRFKPTKIVVEWPAARAADLEAKFADYRAGTLAPSRSETVQIAFRLAKDLGLAPLAADVKGDMDLDAVMKYAQEKDPAFLAAFQDVMTNVIAVQMKMQKEKPIAETLRWMNSPEILAAGQRAYLRMAGVGSGDTYVGAEQVGAWYARNVKIFSNLQRLARPGDRVVVLFGQGHVPILQQLAREAGMTVVDARGFL